MSSSNKENQDKANLEKTLQTKASNKRYSEEIAALREKVERDRQGQLKFQQKEIKKVDQDIDIIVKKLTESQNSKTDDNVHIQSVASMLMMAAPRLKNIAWFARNNYKKGSKKLQHNITMMIPAWHSGHKFAHDAAKKFSPGEDEDIEIPDLKYFTQVSEDGALSQHWSTASFCGLFDNENGEFDPEQAKEVEAELQEAVIDWINSLDYPDAGGYCIGADEAGPGGPPIRKLYPKSACKQLPNEGDWVLKEDKIKEIYDENDLIEHGDKSAGTYYLTPKPGAVPRPGKEPNYIKPAAFEEMRDNVAHPEKSLGSFLEKRFEGVDLSYESPRP
ncbi:MAG: hypothetical protein P1U74_02985 [Legionellaceae bacterium]|nr:hypothetical protein [Legionellaceae bacterium]